MPYPAENIGEYSASLNAKSLAEMKQNSSEIKGNHEWRQLNAPF